MTRTETNTLYEQHIDLIRKTIWEFMRRCGIPAREFDELFSQSNLYFMLATESYVGGRCKFSTWLRTQVWLRLMAEHKKQRRKSGNVSITSIEEPVYKRSSADFKNIDWRLEMSRDAKCLFRLVRRGGLDTDVMTKHRRNGLKMLFVFLREHGWSRKRIHFCFKNLRILAE